MKKTTIQLGKVAAKTAQRTSKATKAIATPEASNNHHVTAVDANADTVSASLGISDDRRKELDKDIVAGLKNAMNGEKPSYAQCIAIAAQHCENDNEVAYATYFVTAGINGFDIQSAIDQINDMDGLKDLQTPKDASTEGAAADVDASENGETPGDEGDDQGFAQFLAMLAQSKGAPAGSEDDDDDNI